MMKQEEIARRIEAVRKRKPWLEARMDRLAKLDPGVRTIGQFMLGYDEKGKHSVADGWNRRNHGIKLLKRLSEPALIGLGEALFPRDTDAFKAAWSLHEQLPYQTGYVRKPFRAPGRPDLLNEPRRSFLGNLLTSLEGIDESLPWLAAHAPYLASYYGDKDLGLLFAGAIDLGGKRGQEVEQVLRDSASGLHEIGQMGRHVTSAFLCCEKADCWEFVEKLLLAAQRQEGLRQAILESVDFARPAAFRRMLRVIDEENLIRFSATIRAADVWLGMQLDSTSARYAAETIRSIATFLDDATARDAAIRGEHPEKAFLGLWSMAFEDAPSALSEATKLLGHRDVEHRFVGVHSLGMLAIRDTYEPLLRAMDDPDPRVAVYASSLANVELKRGLQDHEEVATDQEDQYMFGYHRIIPIPRDSGDYFERLVRLFDRLPARAKEQKPLVWPWTKVTIGRQPVADAMIDALGERPASKVLPYLDVMSPYSRARVAYLLGKLPGLDAEARATLVRLVGDAAGDVRETAAKAMSKLEIAPADLDTLEPLLDRKKSDLRRSVLNLILSLKDKDALASASRLASSKSLPKRLAGLDLLCQMRDLGRAVDRIHSLAESYRETHPSLGRDEQVYLDKLTQAEAETLSLDDAVGLMIDAERTPPSMPRDRGIRLCTPAAFEILKHFDEVIHKHREESITLKAYGSTLEAQPLGAIRYGFPSPMEYDHAKRKTEIRPLDDLPLREIWWEAWEQRSRKARDPDGMEAARALIATSLMNEYRSARRAGWRAESMERLVGRLPKVRYLQVLDDILAWVAFHKAENNLADFVVDGLETILAAIPRDKLADKTKANDYYASESHSFRDHIDEFQALTGLLKNIAEHKGHWTKEHTRRMFGLLRWIDEPLSVGGSKDPAKAISRGRAAFKGVLKAIGVGEPKGPLKGTISRGRMDWESLLEAFEEGWANDHDLCDHLLGTRSKNRYGADTGFDAVRFSTSALYRRELPERSIPIVRKSMARILEIELARGESPTVVTSAALAMRYAGGLDVLVNVLLAIGRDPKLQRTYSWGEGSLSKSSVFSHLIRVTRPGKEDTPEAFARAVQAAGIAENTLLAVAFYAPQWARFVQHALGWPLFEEAVWWFHAHTKDTNWRVESDIRESWNAEIRKLTPLTLEDLTEGAVDVDWFRRTHKALGDQRWARLDEFAKYASGGAGHKRAQLFAGAILGKLDKPTLIQEIQEKRKQDAIRALGLIPIDKKGAKKDVLERYRLMQEFIRGSRQFGSQRQASEKLAARIAQENLARTAGYTDPIRLQWAMEGLETADLANGPVAVQVKDVVVSLAIDPDGQPEISVKRGERPLKSIPPDVKKAEVVEELVERRTQLKRSSSRMRLSLEEAMCRGDAFSGESLIELMNNVILRPMLERLVFIGEGIAGYPVSGGKGLRDQAGNVEPIKKTETLRLAHPADFLESRRWTEWQRDCFASERVQPFKQVFRELYVLTGQERSDAAFSRRYAGQQVNPRQALALLGSRGWITAPEAGVFRTFHHEKMVAWIEFMEAFYTPADIEGLTIERIRFAARGADKASDLKDLPPRLFSEVMRDVDLIVSVAHRGEVDHEASASTVELRSALLKETLSLLQIKNVRIKEPHVFIDGTLGEYSVHLGSATTHMMPGGTLFIVPVHSQHRGRIFLPFADDDPKTAEILSKVILLARDQEIKDPNLLDQIRMLH